MDKRIAKNIEKVQKWINNGYSLEICGQGAWNKYCLSYEVKGNELHLWARDRKFNSYKIAILKKTLD